MTLQANKKRLEQFRRLAIVDGAGRPTTDFWRFLFEDNQGTTEVVDEAQTAADDAQASADAAQTSADNAQTSADTAAQTSAYAISNPGNHNFISSDGVTWPAGNPFKDLICFIYDKDDVEIGRRTLRGTLNSTSGLITVTDQGGTGIATTFVLTGNGTNSVRADVTGTLASGAKVRGVLAWIAVDVSVEGEFGY